MVGAVEVEVGSRGALEGRAGARHGDAKRTHALRARRSSHAHAGEESEPKSQTLVKRLALPASR